MAGEGLVGWCKCWHLCQGDPAIALNKRIM